MDPGEVEALIQSLVANPHDADALAIAHQQGEADPQGYAFLLEQVGTRTEDPSYASHWLSEAANVWSYTLGDAHRAARVLMMAVDRDPTQPLAAERLAQLYRDKGDVKALAAMLDRRVRLLTPMLAASPNDASGEIRPLLASLHEELGKLWNEPPLEQPRKAVDHFKRAIEYEPTSAFSIFSLREIYKSLQQWDDAAALYANELSVEQDPARRLMLARDEAATRQQAGDLAGVTTALRRALDELRQAGTDDPTLAQEVAGSLLDRVAAGTAVDEQERVYGADVLAGLAETWGGEHGIAYAGGALDLLAGHDRAMQLFAYYASGSPEHADSVTLRYHAYLAANPSGPLAPEARLHLAAGYEALGQIRQALQVLHPLRGQAEFATRISALQEQLPADGTETPVGGIEQTSDDGPPSMDTEEALAGTTPEAAKVGALTAARECVAKSDKAGALTRYLEVLAVDPVEPEALSWVEDTLRAKRDYARLRDILWASARAMGHDSLDGKKLRLREIAAISEGNLKDLDGAIQAWRQVLSLDRGDDAARQSLTRALEKTQRWDDLANLYEQEASTSTDTDAKIQLEKKLATLHEQKRNDPLAAAEAWARIAELAPEDERALGTATDLFVKAGKPDLAAAAIEQHVEGVTDKAARAALLDRLGALLEQDWEGTSPASQGRGLAQTGGITAAGGAYQRAAEADPTEERWTKAEKVLARAESWRLAAMAADRVAELAEGASGSGAKTSAEALARSAKHWVEAGDDAKATERLERAHTLAPDVEAHALGLLERYRAAEDWTKLTRLLVARGEGHPDAATRIAARREAAKLYEAEPLGDEEAARTQWRKILETGEDAEALDHLITIAERRDELDEATTLLRRFGEVAATKEEKTSVALREAELLARMPNNIGAAVERYEWVLERLDPKSTTALRAIAELELKRDAPKAAANALERELAISEGPARREVAAKLVGAYEVAGDDAGAFAALELWREADPEDFDVLNRLTRLAEKLEKWEILATLLAAQIEVEADDAEISTLTQKRAALLADKLGRGDEALAALQELADAGDDLVREAYVALGDKLGWRGIVATKLVDWWFPEGACEARTDALKGAFERFAVVGRDGDAVKVGVEILRGSRDAKLAVKLEELAVKTSDDVGLTAAQEILGLDLSGAARAAELVRQAEMRVQAKMAWAESVQHGETALGGLSHDEVGPLLLRLAALIATPAGVIDLYERQVSRARGGDAREKALIRAAQVAGERGDLKRARTFFDLALGSNATDATLDTLERAANEGAEEGKANDGLRRTLAEALAEGGGGVRDGGRSRANFLRRAAKIAHRDLHDIEQAFTWLSEALIAHADVATLDALSSLAEEQGTPKRVDDVLTHVLTEVFDGPLVRLVLARRAKVRKEQLDDSKGAAADLKKLHDLSPTDEAVMSELAALLTDLGDHRSMVQLYEDQILRSKDQAVRAELGRKVAQLWDTELADPREAADAWRRVLRLKPGDEEATQGLERAKTNMVRKGSGGPAPTPKSVPKMAAAAPVAVAAPALAAPPPPPTPVPSPAPTAAKPSAKAKPAPERIPEPAASVEDVSEDELEMDPAPTRIEARPPELERLLGSSDPFGEADTTHTSIDVRLPMAQAKAIEERAAAAAALGGGLANAAGPVSSRSVKPPPLPPVGPYDPNEPPTSPGRRLDAALASSSGRPFTSENALAMTDQNPPVDLSKTVVNDDELTREPRRRDIPPDIVSATDLALDDNEKEDVLVVDEFVEDNDEYEDVVEPSKPPGPLPG